MTKELEQAAKEYLEKRIIVFPGTNDMLPNDIKRNVIKAMVNFATSPEAKAYHEGQGWVSVEEFPDDGESVWFYTPKFNKVLPGYFVKTDAFGRDNFFISYDGGYYESSIVSHYMINKIPLPPKPHNP